MSRELKRQLTVVDAVAILVGIILGSGVFVAPAEVVAVASRPWAAVTLWLIGAIIAVCGGMTYAECAARLPQNGGFFVYYREVYGEALAFVGGWSALLVTYPASTAAIALLGAQYAGAVVPALAGNERWVATGALVVSGFLNWTGVKSGAMAQRLLTAFKVLTVLAVCGAALIAGADRGAEGPPLPGSSFALVLSAMVGVLWSYEGWSDVTFVTGEIRNPEKALGRAVIIGVTLIFFVYAAVQLSVMSLLPPAVAAASPGVLADAVEVALGAPARLIMAAIIVISAFGSVNGIVLATSRLGHAMSVERVIPHWFARISPTRQTPTRAIAAMVVVTIIYIWASDFRGLLEFFGQTIWTFYGLTAVGLVILRRRGAAAAGIFRAPRIAPYVVVLAGIGMSVSLAIANPLRFVIGFVLVSASLPVYFAWRLLQRRGIFTQP